MWLINMLEGWSIFCTIALVFAFWCCLKHVHWCNTENIVIIPVDEPNLVIAPPPYPYGDILEDNTAPPPYTESQELV
jgi:hypothetical protein